MRVGRPLAGVWSWWIGELIALVPRRIRRALTSRKQDLAVQLAPDHALVGRRGEELPDEPIRVDLAVGDDYAQCAAITAALSPLRNGHRAPIALLLSEQDAMLRVFRLPAAAVENLNEVIGFEMDRHTPFRSEEVYFDHRIVGSDGDPPTVLIEVCLAPRDAVDAAMERAGAWELSPRTLGVAKAWREPEQDFCLIRHRTVRSGSHLLGTVNVLLALVVAALGAALTYLPLDRLHDEAERLTVRVETLKREVREAAELRRQIDAVINERRFALDRKSARVPVVVALDRITRTLPDDSWVFQFQMTGNEVEIQGYSADAAKLVGLIEHSRHFHNARFRSRVTREPNGDGQRFDISFDALADQ